MVAHRFDEAIPLLQRAITQSPEDPQPRCLLAICLINVDRAEEAVEMAGSAIALDPQAEWPHRIRSQALAALGEGNKAMQEAEEAVRADPNEAMAFFVLSERLLQRRWHLNQAADAAMRGLALDPDSFLGHDLLARIELRRGHWKEAEIAYRKALTMEPQNWLLMNNLAIALRGQGRQQEAIAMLENAARANPRSTLAQRNLYLETRRYVGIGLFGFLVLFNIGRVVLGNLKDPVAAQGVLEIIAVVIVVLLFIRWRRRRKLSPVVRNFYAAESHRELARTGPFVAVWLVGALGVIFVSLMLFQSLQMGALALMVGGVLAWWFAWRYLWLTMVHPWLRTRL